MKYVSVEEYLNKIKYEDLTYEQQCNVNTLIPKVNLLLEKFGEYRKVNSGFRTTEDHLRIYKEINDKRKAKGLEPVKIPMSSKHLYASAIDLEDSNSKLYNFCKNNVKILEELGIWCEERQGGWLHCQIFPPKSGSRFFNP